MGGGAGPLGTAGWEPISPVLRDDGRGVRARRWACPRTQGQDLRPADERWFRQGNDRADP